MSILRRLFGTASPPPELDAGLRSEMGLPDSPLTVSGLTIPALDDSRDGKLWTLWFDCAGDDHFWYGVQSDDDWDTIHPFADD